MFFSLPSALQTSYLQLETDRPKNPNQIPPDFLSATILSREFPMARLISVVLFCLFPTVMFSADRSWVEVRSPHFSVITDTGEKQGREIVLRFEQMRAVFGSLWHKSKVNIAVPLQIVAFRNQSEFRQFAPLWKGKPSELSGLFQGGDDRNFILLDMSAYDPYPTVFHEYAHLLLHGNFPPMPAWFDEGFAEYFSTLKITGKQVQYGNIPDHTREALLDSKWIPLLDLLNVQRDSPLYNERDKRGIFYAQSWLVVSYLMSNDLVTQGAQYLQLTQIEKKPVPESVQAAFGVDVKTLEKQINDYFHGKGKLYSTDMPSFEEGPFEPKKVDDLTTKAILADVHAHSSDYEAQAVQEFQSVLEQSPNNVIANRGLGYIAMRKGEYDKASELFRRASAGDPKDARLHYLNALLVNREAMKQGRPPQHPAAMEEELKAAIALDPTLADAYNLLAFAYGAQGRYETAFTAQKKAIELNPSSEYYRINLAGLYLQSQRWDDAQTILTRLQSSSDPQIRQNATQNLAAMEANREMAAQELRNRQLKRDDITAPQWRRKEGSPSTSTNAEETTVATDTRKVLYLYGRLQSVDCTADPVAVLSVKSGSKLMKLRTENYKKLLVMGADEFSCGWHDQKVLVNYKPGGKSDGDVVTLELQAAK